MKRLLICLMMGIFLACNGGGDGGENKPVTNRDLSGEYQLLGIQLTCPDQVGSLYASKSLDEEMSIDNEGTVFLYFRVKDEVSTGYLWIKEIGADKMRVSGNGEEVWLPYTYGVEVFTFSVPGEYLESECTMTFTWIKVADMIKGIISEKKTSTGDILRNIFRELSNGRDLE